VATTKLSEKGSKKLNDREMRFVMEYLIDYNGTRAARAVYKCKTEKAYSIMGCKLLKRPHVAAMVGKLRRETLEKLEVDREEALKQVYYLATRSGADFVEEDGMLIENVHNLPERAQQAVDGIEQEVTEYETQAGTIRKVKTKLKLVSKAKVLELAMRHLGLFAPEKHEHRHVTLDWDAIADRSRNKTEVLEAKFVEPERLEDGNGNGRSD
jgi:phage terminase small subunit